MKIKIFLLVFFVSLGGVFLGGVVDVNAKFGISPGALSVDVLKPGSVYEKEFLVSRSADVSEDSVLMFEFVDGAALENWISFSFGDKKNILLKKGVNTYNFSIKVEIPEDANLGDYNASLRIINTPVAFSKDLAETNVKLAVGVSIPIDLKVSNDDFLKYSLQKVDLKDSYTSHDNLDLGLVIENLGNVAISPYKVVLDLRDVYGDYLSSYEVLDFGGNKVKPFSTEVINVSFPVSLEKGVYLGAVKVYQFEDVLLDEDGYNISFEIKNYKDFLKNHKYLFWLINGFVGFIVLVGIVRSLKNKNKKKFKKRK